MPPRKRRKPVYLDWDQERIKALRSHLGMTQEQMAGELGTRQQTISEWENGMYRPRGASARLLSLVAERAGFPYAPRTGTESPEQ
jgi:DNA-binding transcriptional regulator YiaG